MDGIDKASIQIAGRTLLERALTASRSAAEVVVVGRQVPTSRPVTWAAEDPPRGGPAAGLLAGLDRFLVPPDLVLALAVDMPRVTTVTVGRLTSAVEADADVDGALLVDPDGRRQPLAAVYRLTALCTARRDLLGRQHGLPMRRLIATLRLAEVAVVGDEAHDVDTWDDLLALRDSM
jgi:molybdopterin-guanine dinucleotide biosynthesis protein A